MIWHIFRKDLRLLWAMAAFVAGLQLLNAGLLISGGRFARSSVAGISEFGWVSNIALPGVALLGLVVLVIAVVQQDRLPGTTQDWLTRPIPRSRLVAAKLLFVLLTGLLPILAADLTMGWAARLTFADVVAASLTRGAVLLCLVCVPAALIGATTQTLTEALVLVVAVGVALIIEFITFTQIRGPLPVIQSGFGWIAVPILTFLNIGALLILLPLQFRWRSSNRVRWILAAYFCLLPAVAFIPWGAALAIHHAFEFRSTASPVSIVLDTNRSVTFTPAPSYPAGRKPVSVLLRIPVVVDNLGAGNRLYIDRIKLHSAGPAGREDEVGPLDEVLAKVNSFGFVLDRSLEPGQQTPEIRFTLPFDVFNATRAAQSALEIQLLATMLRMTAEKPIQSLAGGSIDNHGRCYGDKVARFGRSDTMISCVSARPIGECYAIRDPSRNLRYPGLADYTCRNSSYAPWPLPLWRDAYYTVALGALDFWQPVDRGDPSSETPKKSERIIANFVPDVHIARMLGFRIGLAVEKSATESRTVDGVGDAARFASPTSAVIDRQGNVFIVDAADSVIRKMTPGGQVDTIAGAAQQTGRSDGVGRDARFNQPRGIAIDSAGNLFVADTGNGLIRKITPAGVVSTLMRAADGHGNPPEPLRFTIPRGVICAADGALYVIDSNAVANGDWIVRKVSPGGVVTTVAGPPEPTVGVSDLNGLVLAAPTDEEP